jgi:hypothetical protein
MRIAVTSTVVFDVPDGRSVGEIRNRLYEAHAVAIGKPMQTLTGQEYVLQVIERLDVERRPDNVFPLR